MARLFGTDGVRGVANTELTGELAFRLGRAGAYVLTKETKHAPRILVAMDTRISGDMLESALVSGICSVGAHAVVAGVIPTPAVAYLVRKYRLDAGVMISASHNPVEYNGIKFFNNQGYKLSDALEDEIENIIMSHPEILPSPTGIGLGTKEYAEDALDDYIAFLTRTTTEKFDGIKVALDCANGAAYKAAPIAMLDLGASLCIIHNEPDGTNINDKCGSTHMDDLKEMVVQNGADIGFAFDGDADRCLAVDEKGNLIDGDKILAICGLDMKERGALAKDTIVGTVMSNLGLTMMGDGTLTAIQLLSVLKRSGKKASELAGIMQTMPQVLVNARVNNAKKNSYMEDDVVRRGIAELEEKFAQDGRVLIRTSGTEPLVRVMIEGTDIKKMDAEARKLAALIEERLQ